MKLKINHKIDKYLNLVEKASNKLPDPFFLFLILSLLVVAISFALSKLGVSVSHPASGELVFVENLLTRQNLQKMFTDMVSNFIGFPPLGLVLASMIGIGIAEKSGFFEASMKHSILKMPDKFLVPAVCFISVNASIIADAGNVVLPPLAGLLFAATSRHPIAGVCASYAAIVGGFSANLSITALDPLLSELTMSAANALNASYEVFPTANYYFMIASVVLVTLVCTFVTNNIVLPRLGKWSGSKKETNQSDTSELKSQNLSMQEKKSLWVSYASITLILLIVAFGSYGETSFFRDSDGSLSILYRSIIPLLILVFGISGLVFGYFSGKIKSGKDLVNMMTESINSMGVYILLAFAAGQFLAYFSWSNLALVTAVKGAQLIQSMNIDGLLVILLFLIFSMVLNLFIASASAKWTILAPVFVPMFMLLGYSPELAQLVYRVADSTTNMITPVLPYFPLIIVYAKKFEPDVSIGKLLSSLLPFSMALVVIWTIFLLLWVYLEISIGPSVNLFY